MSSGDSKKINEGPGSGSVGADEAKKKRGRPKGSKNVTKKKEPKVTETKRGRGRPASNSKYDKESSNKASGKKSKLKEKDFFEMTESEVEDFMAPPKSRRRAKKKSSSGSIIGSGSGGSDSSVTPIFKYKTKPHRNVFLNSESDDELSTKGNDDTSGTQPFQPQGSKCVGNVEDSDEEHLF